MPPLILVTNDDGIDSDGIRILAEALNPLGSVYIFAPDQEKSAVSHSLTLHRPLRLLKKSERIFAINGTPADCVNLGIHYLGRKPDLLVSGINRGENLGDDITYSGTVFGAVEGAIQGIRSFAVSQARPNSEAGAHNPGGWDFRAAGRVAAKIAGKVLEDEIIPPGALLNINVPALPEDKIKGFRITRQGKKTYQEVVVEKTDPRGEKYYWIGADGHGQIDYENSDIQAVHQCYISITPLTIDLTHYPLLEKLKQWKI
ncbi:MAG: 5'/3'-nucleotidase SurE [Proteobacteria bacterium]|nr:5'/3'-nucleotidase SurE [Pseudomonadota bacterium]